MKNIKNFYIKNLVVVLSLVLVLASCDGWIDHDLNIDPDSPSDVPMNLLLPAIQQSMGYNLPGNNSVRTNNIWMQQFDGTDRQSFTEARYQLNPADVNNLWSSTYTEMLMNSTLILNKARTEGAESPNFEGVAQVLMATTLGITTDLFGDIPYSEAFQGSENILKPVYDSQESIYGSIFSLLDDAVVNLNNADNAISLSGDVCYGGDVDNWIKAAYSIKARHAIQLSGINGNAAYTDALAAVANGFTSNTDDFLVPFEDANENPIFQFMEDRGDIRMGGVLMNMLIDNDDPRLEFYATTDANGGYSGSDAGSENVDASQPGPYVASTDSSTKLMTYSELKFIEAEALLMLSKAGATEAYEAAVAASVLRVTGDANQAWLDTNINSAGTVTLQDIMDQKYIESFTTNQAYADYRRTGMPALSVSAGAVLNSIPTRFPYAQGELDYNTENVPSASLTDKVWWDQ